MTKDRKWSDLGRVLGYRGIPGLSTQIKNSYTRVILPFEHYCDRGRNSPALSQVMTRDDEAEPDGQPSRMSATALSTQDASPRGSPMTGRSSPLSEPPDESDLKDRIGKSTSSRLRRSSRTSLLDQSMFRIRILDKSCITDDIF